MIDIQEILRLLEAEGSVFLKYVCVNDRIYRFAIADYFAPDHKSMVKEGEKVISAGYCKVKMQSVSCEEWSMTLKIGPDAQDEELIFKLLWETNCVE